jgi:hypothetical protein
MEDKWLAAIGPNPSGLCMCGCGRKTKIVTKSDRRHGHVMRQPLRFIHGHVRPPAKGPNRFKLRRRAAVIFLERRDGTVLECLVSRKDFHRVRRHHWYANRNGKRASYAVAWIDGAQVQMHKHLCPHWAQVNHQNGNGLDKDHLVSWLRLCPDNRITGSKTLGHRLRLLIAFVEVDQQRIIEMFSRQFAWGRRYGRRL